MKYKFPVPYPLDGSPRAEWRARGNRVTEMVHWINEQKWNHWGLSVDDDGVEHLYFAHEDEYLMFVLRWA